MSVPLCTLPWTGLDIDSQGGIKPCCKYNQTISTDIDDYLSSPILKRLQDDFLAGQQPAGCQRCWNDEAAGLSSKRQLDQQYVLNGDSARDHVKILAITFGNTCNLSCVTCGSFASSKWAQEESRMAERFPSWKFFQHKHAKFYKDDSFLHQIKDLSHNLVHLEISGGEPFFASADIHKRFLRSLPNPEKIKIHYITNATVFPDREFWEIWRDFRHIDIQLSLDAVGRKFEYLRYPAVWAQVLENVRRYQQHDHIQISISHTVSWINILYLPEFLAWCQEQGLPKPYLGPVASPIHLNLKCLPPEIKEKIRHRLDSFKTESIRNMLNHMDQEDLSQQWPKAREWIDMLDQARSMDFGIVFPEIQELLDGSI